MAANSSRLDGLTVESIMAFGMDKAAAEVFISKARTLDQEVENTAQLWWRLVQEGFSRSVPFQVQEHIYNFLTQEIITPGAVLPAWQPTHPEQTFISKLMRENDLPSFPALHAWSRDQPEAFYKTMCHELAIQFQKEPDRMVDLANGPEQPRWLPGARLNIAESCLDGEEKDRAIVFRRTGGAPLECWSLAELNSLSRRIANSLRAQGFQKGDAIAVAMSMSPESVAIYLGIVLAGCVVISIADSFSPSEIATRLRIGQAKGIFTCDVIARGSKSLPMYAKVRDANAPTAIVLTHGNTLAVPIRPGDLTWDGFLSQDDSFSAVACDPHDMINILFSSGTTGDPKAIPWNHTTPLRCGIDGRVHQDIGTGTVVAWPTNLGWMMGPWLIFATLLNRGTIALFDDAPTGTGFCRFVQDARVNVLGVVPSLVRAWRQSAAAEELDWSAMQCFSSTGECSNASDMLYLMSLGGYKPVIEYCGGTEIGGAYLTGTLVQPAAPATFTTPSLGLDLHILNEAGQVSDQGEVYLVPPAIGLSTTLLNRDHHQVYFEGAPQGPEGLVLRRHGDQLERLPGGFLRALGRADDTMNLGGIKTSSAEIERCLKPIEGVVETAAIAISPPGGGPSLLVIYAVLDAAFAADVLQQTMQRAIRQQLNPLFKIHAVREVDILPRTASGKVMRRVLRDRFEQGL